MSILIKLNLIFICVKNNSIKYMSIWKRKNGVDFSQHTLG